MRFKCKGLEANKETAVMMSDFRKNSRDPWFGRTVFLVGSSSGLGWQLTKDLLARGARVTGFSRRTPSFDGDYRHVFLDLQEPDSAKQRLRAAIRDDGLPDLLLVTAGISAVSPMSGVDWEQIQLMTTVNYLGPAALLAEIVPDLIQRGRGQIAVTTAISSWRGLPRAESYLASKAALTNFLESLRLDLKSQGVHVTTLMPAFIDTPMSRQYDFHKPFLWSAEKASRYILARLPAAPAELRFSPVLSFLSNVLSLLPPVLFDPLARATSRKTLT